MKHEQNGSPPSSVKIIDIGGLSITVTTGGGRPKHPQQAFTDKPGLEEEQIAHVKDRLLFRL